MEYGRVVAARVLIVIPTLGKRPHLLEQTMRSVTAQSVEADVVVVGPRGDTGLAALARDFGAHVMPDPGSQAAAINLGVGSAASHHEFVNWLGDDDLLTVNSLADTTSVLDRDPEAVLAFGACDYIDEAGALLWTSRAGSWAPKILGWGPDLIPQPGMLVRTSSWQAVGGLDESLRFAFDLDLLLSLRKHGDFVFTNSVVSCFRWHPDSLTVADRTQSLDESETVKRRYLGPRARSLAWSWEGPVRLATRIAANRVTRRSQRVSASKTRG